MSRRLMRDEPVRHGPLELEILRTYGEAFEAWDSQVLLPARRTVQAYVIAAYVSPDARVPRAYRAAGWKRGMTATISTPCRLLHVAQADLRRWATLPMPLPLIDLLTTT